MAKTIRHILNFYLYSSLHIGICSVLLYMFTMERFTLVLDRNYLIFLLASTIFTYSIHRIIGMNKVKKFAHKGRFAVIARFRTHIIAYAILGGLASIGLYVAFDQQLQFLLLGAGILSVLYTLPIFGKKMRLRDFSYIKIFLIAGVWAYVTETIPLLLNGIERDLVSFLFIERVCFFLAITIPFDIRDLEVDKVNNVKTIPTLLGSTNATYLSLTLILIAALIDWFVVQESELGVYSTIVAYALTAVLIWLVRRRKSDYFFSGMLDATIMLPYLLLMAARSIN